MTTSAIATLAVERLLRRRDVEQMTGMSCSTIYRKMDIGEFPRPRRIGTGLSGAVAWRLSDIKDWMESRPVADPKNLIEV